MKYKKGSAVLIILIVSFVIVSSGVIITNEVKKSNNENDIVGTGLVLFDNEQDNFDTLSDSSNDGTKLFTFGDSGGKSSSKKKSSSSKSSSGGGSSVNELSTINEDLNYLIIPDIDESFENQTVVNNTDNTEEENNLNLLEPVSEETNDLIIPDIDESFENQTVVNNTDNTEENQSLPESAEPGPSLIAGTCKQGSRETNEGPGGQYCTFDNYEECYDYKTKSTAIAYDCNLIPPSCFEYERGTDYCSDVWTLQEAYLNCGIGRFAHDSVEFKEKNCNDFDSTTDFVYYCTSTEVKKAKYLYNYGCSDSACNIIGSGWIEDTIVSEKGDGDYCTKRKQHTDAGATGCTLCGYEDYDCDFDSQCSGNLECKGNLIGSDGCCFSDEDWDSNTNKCISQQECTSGTCCDGYYYRSSNYVCDYNFGDYYYGCSDGQCLGDDVKKQDRRRYCSGESSSCSGAIEWNNWQVYDSCTSSEFCDSSNAGYNSPFSCSQTQCTSGMCCDASCGEYSFLSQTSTCAYSIDYGCPDGKGVSNPGADVYIRTRPVFCSGESSSCDGDYGNWDDWSLHSSCTSDQYCTDDNPNCNNCGYHTNYKCFENDVYFYDDCNNKEDKKQECGAPGCSNGECIPEIECSSDSECGTDGYVGDLFCSGDDVYQSYVVYSCNNPGTTSAYCSSGDTDILIEDCQYGCEDGVCIGPEPDLTITDLVIQNINGQTVVLAFTVKNIGELAATDIYWMVDTDSSDTNPERTTSTSLEPGSWTRAYMMLTYSQSGTYNPEVIVDFNNVVSESDENNNKLSLSLTV